MSHRTIVLITLAAASLAACAPDSRDDGSGGDAGVADAAPESDASSFVDAMPPVDPDDFTVYVHSRDTLYRLDPVTYDLILVGPFNAPNADLITDLAVAPDDTIYVISKTTLYTASAVDGHVTKKATIQSGPTAGNVGLTYLPTGELLATDSTGGVRTIDPVSGAVDELGEFSGGYATAGDLVAIENGTMYGISDKGPVGDEGTNNLLLTVNTSTGLADAVGPIGFGKVFGAAFVKGKVLAFTTKGEIIEIDRMNGAGTLKKTVAVEFWGAGVTPLVPPVD